MAYSAITLFFRSPNDLSGRDLLPLVFSGGCNLKCSWCAVSALHERSGGCNLKCSWCAVSALHEQSKGATLFQTENYRALISGLSQENLIGGVAIVGDEPLLDAAWPVARGIFDCAEDHHLPSALVTNGTKLAEHRTLISGLSREKVMSGVAIVGDEPLLDAAWPVARGILDCADHHQLPSALITNGTKLSERSCELATRQNQILLSLEGTRGYHDAKRGVAGAYDALIRGLESAFKLLALCDRITVSSVVQPDKFDCLDGLPDVLSRYGFERWARLVKEGQLHELNEMHRSIACQVVAIQHNEAWRVKNNRQCDCAFESHLNKDFAFHFSDAVSVLALQLSAVRNPNVVEVSQEGVGPLVRSV